MCLHFEAPSVCDIYIDTFVRMYVQDWPLGRPKNNEHPSSNEHAQCPDYGLKTPLPTKNQK